MSIASTIGMSSTSASPSPTSSGSVTITADSQASFSTSMVVSTPTSASTGVSTNPQPDHEGLSSEAKIGIAVAIPLVVILISAMAGFWIRHKLRRHQDSTKSLSPDAVSNAQELPVSEVPQELPEKKDPGHFQHEMQGDPPPIAELAAERYSRGTLPKLNHYSSR